MYRTRPNRKAPDIDILAHAYLGRGLSRHPNIAKHVERVEEVEQMGMWALLTLAKKMGVDPDDMIRKTEHGEHQLRDYSSRFPGFKGELEFDLTIALVGKTVTRKAKVVYEHTPEWEYYDSRKRAPFTGWASSSYHIEIAAVPEDWDGDGEPIECAPYWVRVEDITQDDVLPDEVWDALLDAVDEKCKAEDAERRRVAAAGRAAVGPTSKRQH